MPRRRFLRAGAAAGLAFALPGRSPSGERPEGLGRAVEPRIDTNVSLFQWPGRRLPLDTTPALLQTLASHGITQAWAGTFEGLLQRDLARVNDRLAAECRKTGSRLLPFGSVNLTLPGWEKDLQRCHEVHGMPGIRLHPNYHGYELSDPRFKRLLGLAAERRLLVQIACLMEDTRTQSPLLRAPDVDLTALPEILGDVPAARILLLNSGKLVDRPLFRQLLACSGIGFDTARIDSVGGLARLWPHVPPGRLVFGSHAPFFIYEAAVLKVFEAELPPAARQALATSNPVAWLRT